MKLHTDPDVPCLHVWIDDKGIKSSYDLRICAICGYWANAAEVRDLQLEQMLSTQTQERFMYSDGLGKHVFVDYHMDSSRHSPAHAIYPSAYGGTQRIYICKDCHYWLNHEEWYAAKIKELKEKVFAPPMIHFGKM